jgi:hypothetical protein
MTERVRVEVNEDSDFLVIPSGMTKPLQPLEVSSFKVTLRQLHSQWITVMKHELMSCGRMKHSTSLTVCVNGSLQHGTEFLQKLRRKVTKLLEYPMKWMADTIS